MGQRRRQTSFPPSIERHEPAFSSRLCTQRAVEPLRWGGRRPCLRRIACLPVGPPCRPLRDDLGGAKRHPPWRQDPLPLENSGRGPSRCTHRPARAPLQASAMPVGLVESGQDVRGVRRMLAGASARRRGCESRSRLELLTLDSKNRSLSSFIGAKEWSQHMALAADVRDPSMVELLVFARTG